VEEENKLGKWENKWVIIFSYKKELESYFSAKRESSKKIERERIERTGQKKGRWERGKKYNNL